MAKLGTKKKPAVVRVRTEARAGEIMEICQSNGWQVIVGIEPENSEDISDVEKLLKKAGSPVKSDHTSRKSPNDYCICGSGKKHKNCCMGKPETSPTRDVNFPRSQSQILSRGSIDIVREEKNAPSQGNVSPAAGRWKRWFQSLT